MILKNPKARSLLIAKLVSSIGTGIHLLALGQMLFNLTGSPKAFSMVLAFQGVGAICILLFSGPLVDALNSKHVYIACDIARCAAVLFIVGITMFPIADPIPAIVGAAIFLAIFDNVQRSALFKFCAYHISGADLLKLNSLLGVAIQAGILAGVSLLGLILIKGTASQALLIEVAMSAVSAALVASIKLEKDENQDVLSAAMLKKAVGGLLSDWSLIFDQFRSELMVVVIILICAADFVLSYSFSMLAVPLVDVFYAKQSWLISALEGTFALGMLSATACTRSTARQRLLPLWFGVQAVCALLLAHSPRPVVHFSAFFLAGFANLNSLVWLLTALQNHAAQADKAKMASLRLLSIGIGTAVLLPLVGQLAAGSLRLAFTGVAVIMACFTAGGLWVALAFRPKVNWSPTIV